MFSSDPFSQNWCAAIKVWISRAFPGICFMSLLTLRTRASCRSVSPCCLAGRSFFAHCMKMFFSSSSRCSFFSEKRPIFVFEIRAGLLVIIQTGQSASSRSCSRGRTISSLKSIEPKMKSVLAIPFSSSSQVSCLL